MKVVPMNSSIRYSTSLVILLSSWQLNAACSRDDISFYLEKGFSTDQVTKLCSETVMPMVKKSDAIDTNNETVTPVDEDILYLMQAIKAQRIKVTEDALQYTKKICFSYGEEDLFGFQPKTCPNVKFKISLKSLDVVRIGKENYLYGESQVVVKSKIDRDIIGGLNDLDEYDRSIVLESFEKNGETAIPVREDFSLEKVKLVLERISG